jgi:hypothetical protein
VDELGALLWSGGVVVLGVVAGAGAVVAFGSVVVALGAVAGVPVSLLGVVVGVAAGAVVFGLVVCV